MKKHHLLTVLVDMQSTICKIFARARKVSLYLLSQLLRAFNSDSKVLYMRKPE